MSTLSVPLPAEIENSIKQAVIDGHGSNSADLARTAIKKYLEYLAVQDVLNAQKEPSLEGELDELAKKL